MSGLRILPEAVAADPARFRPLFGLEAAPAAEAEAPAAAEAEVPEAEAGSEEETPPAEAIAAVISEGQKQAQQGETKDRGSFAEHADGDEAPAGGQPGLEPYTLNSISAPAGDEPAEADAAPDAEAAK